MTDRPVPGERYYAPGHQAALRRFAVGITVITVLGHTILGFEQSYAQPLVALATGYGVQLLLESLEAWSRGRRTVRQEQAVTEEPFRAGALPARLVLVAAAAVGFAFLLMELVWYRMLSPLLGGTTFMFGLVSALGFLCLVQSNLIGLDENVNPKLGWTLPARA